MENSGQSGNTGNINNPRENYIALIELIEKAFEEIYQNKGMLNDASNRNMYLNIRAFLMKNDLMQSISKNEWVLEQISERNFQRHKELVELIEKKTELRRLIIKVPAGAGGIRKNNKTEQNITDINHQIELIITRAESESDQQ